MFDGIGNPGEQVCYREALGQGIKDEMEKDLAGGEHGQWRDRAEEGQGGDEAGICENGFQDYVGSRFQNGRDSDFSGFYEVVDFHGGEASGGWGRVRGLVADGGDCVEEVAGGFAAEYFGGEVHDGGGRPAVGELGVFGDVELGPEGLP